MDKRRPQRRRSRDEANALARVRSHVRRRLLAKALPPTRRVLEGLTLQQAIAREAPGEVEFHLDEFVDFTYFVRLTDGERLIWEGDLGASSGFVVVGERELSLSLRHADLEWMGRAGHVKRGCKIAVVLIRNHDQAMVSLGQFELDRSGKYGLPPYGTCYGFHRSTPLFSSARSRLHLLANLTVAQDATVRHLELRLCHLVQVPQVEDVHRNRASPMITFSFDMSSLTSPAFTTPPRALLPRIPSRAGSWRRSGGRAGRRQRRGRWLRTSRKLRGNSASWRTTKKTWRTSWRTSETACTMSWMRLCWSNFFTFTTQARAGRRPTRRRRPARRKPRAQFTIVCRRNTPSSWPSNRSTRRRGLTRHVPTVTHSYDYETTR